MGKMKVNQPKRWIVQPQPDGKILVTVDGVELGKDVNLDDVVLALSNTLSNAELAELAAELLRATGYRPEQN